MQGYEKKILMGFIDAHEEIMGNAGCNDFPLSEQQMTSEEKQQLIDDYCDHMKRTGGWTEEDVKWAQSASFLIDHCVLSMLREKLEKELK